MSNVAQKRPFASLMDDEPNDSTPPLSPFQPIPELADLMTTEEKKWCNHTIKSLKKHKRAIAFLDPVDPIQFNIPDYFDIVKHPMDLGTVEKKLSNKEYPTMDDFKADVQLIFDNCYLYNHAGDPVCLDAKKLEEHYHKLCKREPVHTTTAHNYSPTLKVRLPSTALDYNSPHTLIDDIKTPPEHTSIVSTTKFGSMSEEDYKRCKAIVRELKKPKYQGFTWPFKVPVDAAAMGATNYYDIIKHPMDMSTYEQKLNNFEYKSESELIDDIRLMFKNCYTYNPPDHLIHNLGKEFEQMFERQWAKLQTRSLHKKSTSSSTLKRRHASTEKVHTSRPKSDDADYVEKEEPHVVKKQKTAPIPTTTHNNTPASVRKNSSSSEQHRSTILRLKIPVKPPKEEEEEVEPLKSKTPVKTPSLALSSKPPSATTTPNKPKLAIGAKPTSPLKEKKPQTNVLHNHDKWLELTKRSPPPTIKKTKETIAPSPKPKEPVTPAAPTFDINDIYNKIHNEKKLNEQKKREEQERWEKSERLRLEREKVLSEERKRKQREFMQQQQAKRQKENQERLQRLNEDPIDISEQKLRFARFEATQLARDQDWRDIYTWQRETIDYRHIPVPGFVKRAPINLSDLRKRLLTKCVRLKQIHDDDGSDMDID